MIILGIDGVERGAGVALRRRAGVRVSLRWACVTLLSVALGRRRVVRSGHGLGRLVLGGVLALVHLLGLVERHSNVSWT